VYDWLHSKSKQLYSREQLFKILLDPKLQLSDVLCSKAPTSISSSIVFIVDVNKFDDPNDLLCDDMVQRLSYQVHWLHRNLRTQLAMFFEEKLNGELPRSRDQAYYLQKKLQQKAGARSMDSSVGRETRDTLCCSAEGFECFAQDVTCTPEPIAVLATNQQLFDMERFCCNDLFKFSIVGIDPTFNLREFRVIRIVYKQLLLEDAKYHNAPLVLGPLLVHHQKQFQIYKLYSLNGRIGN